LKAKKLISAAQSRFAAQVFNLASMIVTAFPPLLMIWIAASIFVYASVAHHPNERVRQFNRIAGYRFYGIAGALLMLGSPIYSMVNAGWKGLLVVWAVLAVVVIPWGIWDLIKARKENWQDMVIEVTINE